MLPILLLTSVGVVSVHGHGGVVWPPSWQDGVGRGIDEVYNEWVQKWPQVDKDPRTNRDINNIKSWLTGQAFTGGHGLDKVGTGPHTNTDHCDMKWGEECCRTPGSQPPHVVKYEVCAYNKHPWAAPGLAPNLGGGCGIHGGNPYGCPAHNDTRKPGSQCPSDTEDNGTWSYGSAAIDLDLTSMVTKWARGSIEPVAFVAIHHGGGYTYRLCKMPREGKTGLTEECFTKNILKFAENKSYWRNPGEENLGTWQEEPKTDLTVGTYPEGSAWRYFGPIDRDRDHGWYQRFFKDLVVVPEDLELGEYVLSWRWDAATGPQVWVSCSSIEIVDEIIGSQIKCNGADNCCTAERPCGRNEGDCDSDSDCVGDLMCGANNCLDIAENQGKGFDSNDDCCYSPIIG